MSLMRTGLLVTAFLVTSGPACSSIGPKVTRSPGDGARTPPTRASRPLPQPPVFYEGEGACGNGHENVFLVSRAPDGKRTRRRIGCGSAFLEGGMRTSTAVGDAVGSAFALIVEPEAGRTPPRGDETDEERPTPRPDPDAVPEHGGEATMSCTFWGPSGKPFHNREGLPRTLKPRILQGRWLHYGFTLPGAPGAGFLIADSRSGETQEVGGTLISEISFHGQQAFYLEAPSSFDDPKEAAAAYLLKCLDLPSMWGDTLLLLPKIKEDLTAAIRWTTDGQIEVTATALDSGKRIRSRHTCKPPAASLPRP